MKKVAVFLAVFLVIGLIGSNVVAEEKPTKGSQIITENRLMPPPTRNYSIKEWVGSLWLEEDKSTTLKNRYKIIMPQEQGRGYYEIIEVSNIILPKIEIKEYAGVQNSGTIYDTYTFKVPIFEGSKKFVLNTEYLANGTRKEHSVTVPILIVAETSWPTNTEQNREMAQKIKEAMLNKINVTLKIHHTFIYYPKDNEYYTNNAEISQLTNKYVEIRLIIEDVILDKKGN